MKDNLIGFSIFGIIIAVIILIIGFFKFYVPVEKEREDLGYGKYDTMFVHPETGEPLPKNQVNKYYNLYK